MKFSYERILEQVNERLGVILFSYCYRKAFHRLGEIRDRGFEQQRYRASGLNLLTAAIVLWNTVYLQRAVQALRSHGQPVDEVLLPYLSPLGWEHINLTGDYSWRTKRALGKFQPLRPLFRP